jgi:hypothetical protein
MLTRLKYVQRSGEEEENDDGLLPFMPVRLLRKYAVVDGKSRGVDMPLFEIRQGGISSTAAIVCIVAV